MILGKSLSKRRSLLILFAFTLLSSSLGLGDNSSLFGQEAGGPDQAEIAIQGVAEAPATKGWDEKIDEAFKPIADWFGL